MSLRLRLTLLVAGAVAVAVAAVSVATFFFARRELRSEIDEFLLARAAIVDLVPAAGLREGIPRPFSFGEGTNEDLAVGFGDDRDELLAR